MGEPQNSSALLTNLRRALVAMIMIGMFALGYVLMQSMSVPKNGLDRFAEGELKKLIVMSNPVVQPTRSFTGPGDTVLTLKDFRGKYVLLNVWATWCPPCVAEIPSLDQLQRERGGSDFQVVAVSLDRNRVEAESWFKTKGINSLAVYHDQSRGLGTDVGAAGLPVSIFYDPKGREIARVSGEVDWQSDAVTNLINALQ